jgi:lipopolysaccharide export system permease protein
MLVNKLIIQAVFQAFLVVMLAVMGIFFLVLLIGELSSIGHFHYSVMDAVLYCVMLLPSQLYTLLPMLGFLAAILGLGRLSSQNELVAVRAAGFSNWQIMKAVIFAAFFLMLIITWLGETYAFSWAQKAQFMKNTALNQVQVIDQKTNVWLKGDHQLIFIQSIDNPKKASGVSVFDFDQSDVLTHVFVAKEMIQHNHQWIMPEATQMTIGEKQVSREYLHHISLTVDFKPSYVQSEHADPASTSERVLWEMTSYRIAHHLPSDQMSFAFWLRLFQPLNTVIMIWLGIPFVFGSLRHSTMGFRLLMGIVVGFSFYILNQIIGPLCLLYQWPPILAAVIPSILLVVLGIILLKTQRS